MSNFENLGLSETRATSWERTQWVPSGTSASVADLLHMEHVKWY